MISKNTVLKVKKYLQKVFDGGIIENILRDYF